MWKKVIRISIDFFLCVYCSFLASFVSSEFNGFFLRAISVRQTSPDRWLWLLCIRLWRTDVERFTCAASLPFFVRTEHFLKRTKRNRSITIDRNWKKGRGGFRIDRFTAEYTSQNERRWVQFRNIGQENQNNLFAVDDMFAESICAHFSSIDSAFTWKISKVIIVDVLECMRPENDSSNCVVISSFKSILDDRVYFLKVLAKEIFCYNRPSGVTRKQLRTDGKISCSTAIVWCLVFCR